MDNYELDFKLAQLEAANLMLRVEIDSIKQNDDDAVEPEEPMRPGEAGGGSDLKWSYQVTNAGGLNVKVAAGTRRVIHLRAHEEADNDAEETVAIPASSQQYIFRRYNYETESWGALSLSNGIPEEVLTDRTFVIAQVTSSEEAITSIVHRHLGDLEVYALAKC